MNFTASRPLHAASVEKVAIIGMAFQLPGGATDADSLWQMLCDKRSGITEIPSDRFSTEKFYDPDPEALGKSYTKWAGVLDRIDQFDPKFFGLAPREAAGMDPQQRLVLQTVYGAVEDARFDLATLARLRTGVFVGVSQSDYKTIREMNPAEEEKHAGTGYAMSIVANRVSHRLNLTGPSFSVDTACSSSLVALDQGVRNLQAGTCDLAFVAGVNVIAHPGAFVAFSKAGMLSPTGELSTFDKAANGYVRGEGVGVVLLKPYDRAVHDGDTIHAVIEATAVNQDGQTGTMTAPSQDAQIKVIDALFRQSGCKPQDVGYAEAHGTGTPVGDPIEAGSIGQAIGRRLSDRKLFIGSIKPNIGHLESAAGMAGVVKAVLSLQKGLIPPNHRFSDPNPLIPLDALNLEVPQAVTPFPAVGGQRRAIVNSFGFGGTNASVLLASAPEKPARAGQASAPDQNAERPVLIPLTAASPQALSGFAAQMREACDGLLAKASLSDIAAALAARPGMFSYRAVVLCRTPDDLISGLDALAAETPSNELPPHVRAGQVRRVPHVVFTYSGQGNQSWNMARELKAHDPVFRSALEEFDAAYAEASGWSILEEMDRDEAESRIHETWVTQPALAAVQYALAALWKHWGVEPDMVMGHSVGEVAASIDCGAVPLGSAMRYLAKRSTIRDHISAEGAMAAVGLPPDDVAAMLPATGLIDIAGRNGPGATTISGERAAVEAFVEEFQFTYPDSFIRMLKVDGAWHSHQLDEAETWLRDAVGSVDWNQPCIPFLSTVTAKLETRLDLNYCWQNLRQTVRYMDAVEAAIDLGATTFVEIGPHATLKPLTLSTAMQMGASVEAVSSLNHKESDLDHFARSAADLFVQGVDLDWQALYGKADPALQPPGYSWDNDRLWGGSEESDRSLFELPDHPVLGQRAPGPELIWTSEIDINTPAFLKDHRYTGEALFPAAGYLDMMLAAGQVLFPDQIIDIENCVFHAALFLPSQGSVQMQTIYDEDRSRIEIFSRLRNSSEDWTMRASATMRAVDVRPAGQLEYERWAEAADLRPDLPAFYAMLQKAGGVVYGPAFQTIESMEVQGKKACATLSLKDSTAASVEKYVAHPALLDGALHTLIDDLWVDGEMGSNNTPARLPTGLARLRCYGRLPARLRINVHGDRTFGDASGVIDIADETGQILLCVQGLRAQEMPAQNRAEDDAAAPPDYIVEEFEKIEFAPQVSETPGRWLVLADEGPEATALAAALSGAGATVERYGHTELGDDITDALADLLVAPDNRDGSVEPISGVVFAWSLAVPDLPEDCAAETVYSCLQPSVQSLIEMGVALHDLRGGENMPRVVVLTSGARQAPGDQQTVSGLAQSSLVGTARTIASELPELLVRHVDLSPEYGAEDSRVPAAILGTTDESEVALRNDSIFAPRLKIRDRTDLPRRRFTIGENDRTNFNVTMSSPGVIDRLDLFECPRAELGAQDVRIEIKAVGLNFRDIMAVTALLPEEAEAEPAWKNLGLEFAGRIVEVGAEVKDFAVGDRVMGMGRNCLQRFLSIEADGLIPMHDGLDYDAAVTIPSAFATAHYALNEVGRLREGEKVLIHVATGGVGLAAVQMAQSVGAEIFATAGSNAKREKLRALGVPHVMNSRSLDYADEIMELTGGKGVDVILNSLPGNNIDKGLDILAPYGRFLEIGKRDVYADHAIGMKAMRRNLSFNVIDLAAMGVERPDLLARQMAAVMEAIQTGELKPLPTSNFPVSDVRGAFRFMSQAQHVGKVVVTFDEKSLAILEDRDKPMTFRNDSSYLVTGGTRGFSLALADWMSRQGAGRLLLASRSGAVAEEDRAKVDAIVARGTEVREVALDVTDEDAVKRCVVEAAGDPEKSLAGILHGAAVIKDALLTMMTPDVVEDVLRPKVIGGWALHRAEAALEKPLDFIVGFSSVAQAIGSLGQSNYVAANIFLDALADYRGQRGLSGGTLDWGVIADAGFVARDEQLASYLETAGMAGVHTEEAEHALATLLQCDSSRFCYARGDWKQVGRANAALGRTPRFKSMISGGGKEDSDLARRLAPLSGDALVAEIAAFVTSALSDLLKVDLGPDDADMPMSEAGLDSLSSFELKMRLETELGITIMVSHFLKAPTIAELSKVLAQAFEEEREKSTVAESASEEDGGIARESTVSKRAFTDAQSGVVALSTARFTSDHVRRALEHRTTIALPEDTSDADIQQALYALFMEYPLTGLTCDILPGEAPVIAMGEAPRLSRGHLSDQELLNVGQGALIRIGREGDTLQIAAHAAIADAQAVEVLASALLSALNNDAGDVPPDGLDAPGLLSSLAFEAETAKGVRDRAFWEHALREMPGPVRFEGRGRALGPERMGLDHGPVETVSGRLPTKPTESQALRAYAAALRDVAQDAEEVLVVREFDARPSGHDGGFGPFTVTLPIVVPVLPREDWVIPDFERILAAGQDHLGCDLFAAIEEFGGRFDGAGARPRQIGFAWGPEVCNRAVAGTLHDVHLSAELTGDGVSYRFAFDADVVGKAEREAIVQTFAERLEDIVADDRTKTHAESEPVA